MPSALTSPAVGPIAAALAPDDPPDQLGVDARAVAEVGRGQPVDRHGAVLVGLLADEEGVARDGIDQERLDVVRAVGVGDGDPLEAAAGRVAAVAPAATVGSGSR